jgi:hypothetical protein
VPLPHRLASRICLDEDVERRAAIQVLMERPFGFRVLALKTLAVQAVDAEVAALLSCRADKLTDDGRQRLVRQSWPYRSGHCALPALARPRQRLRVRPLFVGDLTSLQAPGQEPRPNAIGWLSRRGFARAVDLAHPEALLDQGATFA